jgi:hypothetical protein
LAGDPSSIRVETKAKFLSRKSRASGSVISSASLLIVYQIA